MLKTHLIIVPCHSIWNPFHHSQAPNGRPNLGQNPEHWFLAPFQLQGDDHLAFIKHGLYAIITLLKDKTDSSLLVFSGSQTKKPAGPLSESQSYYLLMRQLLRFSQGRDTPNFDGIGKILTEINQLLEERGIEMESLFTTRITTEEYALASFDNMIYSIYRFKQITDVWPTDITIVGFGFKRARFEELHAKAIDFPKDRLNYISIDPSPKGYTVGERTKYFEHLDQLEQQNAVALFAKDWFATRDPLLSKKQSRNPFQRFNDYEDVRLFNLKSPIDHDKLFFDIYIRDKMPWSVVDKS